MARLNFETSDQEAALYLPAGEYPVQIVSSKLQETRSGGQMLVLQMQVLDGRFRGFNHFERLNVINHSEIAQEKARATLRKIEIACGRFCERESENIHYRPFLATFAEKDEGEYGIKNELRGARPFANPSPAAPLGGDHVPEQYGGPAPAPAPARSPAPGSRPW